MYAGAMLQRLVGAKLHIRAGMDRPLDARLESEDRAL